ncbi:MAG: threonyl-tRNA synthetase editing domain-containing protein [Candidatus Hydrothermarchaeota archaeon]
MKILFIHSDYISFEPTKKVKIPVVEDIKKEKTTVHDCLVCFTAVEKIDEDGKTLEKTLENIIDVAEKVKAKDIVLYPFAHLSSNLASPKIAVELLNEVHKRLEEKNYRVTRAPFGWYKKFELKCKGHPLSELSRSIE